MLVTLTQILNSAKEKNTAVGAFNTFDLESTEAIISAAEKEKSPVIIQITEKTIKFAGLEEIYNIMREEAENAEIPVAIHLDHGKDEKLIKECVDLGFSSVMFDGSRLPFEENIAKTKEIVEYAHEKGVDVEAELGGVGLQTESIEDIQSLMTNPDQAGEFVEKTGIDALAIGCGTAHGLPLPEEKIHPDVIKNVAEKVPVPLVLHGSSNIPDDQIKDAITSGIRKINIDTELRQAFTSGVKEDLAKNPSNFDPRSYLGNAKEELAEKVQQKIQLFAK